MATNKRPLKAFVRYDGSGRAVSSSLVWRKNKPKVGTWREVQGYECCEPPTLIRLIIQDIELPIPYDVAGASLIVRCVDGLPFMDLRYIIQDTPPTTITTYVDMLNYLNTYFNYPGFSWELTGPTTLEAIIDANFLTEDCATPNQVIIDWLAAL